MIGRLKNKASSVLRSKPKVKSEEELEQKRIAHLAERKVPNWSQLKQLGKVLSKTEKRTFAIVLLVFILSGLGLVTSAYFNNTTAVPDYGGSYTEGLIGSVRFVNPLLAPSNDVDRDISQLVFSGLVKSTTDGQIVPDIARSFSISEDGTTYLFDLRDDVYWHDGELLTAEDVVFTIQTIQDPEFKSPLRPSFAGITVEAIDQFTVRFILDEAFAPFLASLTVGIIPRHIWYPIPAANASLSEYMTKPVGTGPFKFKSLTKDNRSGVIRLYTLEANQDFYDKTPYLAEVNFKFYPDFLTGVEALQNNNVDGLSLLPKENRLHSNLSKKINIHNLSLPQYTAIFFNPNNNEVLADLDIRQALAYGTNRQIILEQAIASEGEIINSPILPGNPAFEGEVKMYDFNPEEANKLLEEAGWTIKEDNVFRTDEEGNELSLTLTTVDQPENTSVLTIIKDNWESIGIKTELNIVPKEQILREVIEPRNYQLLLFGQVVGQTNDPYPFWHSSQIEHPGLNLSILANKDVDSFLEDARNADSQVEEVEAYKEFQKKLQEVVFAIFLYNPSYSYPVSDRVKGLDSLTSINIPAERFLDITNWYIETKRIRSN